jgi:diketogulonate reductase-like aldo/keto reductase
MTAPPGFTLSNQIVIPSIGFGTFQINGDTVKDVVKNALLAGYRHIDTASAYLNEAEVGEAISESGLDRKNIFIANKLWNTNRGYDKAIKAFRRTLKILKVDYLDLYLIHWPASYKLYDNWKEINADTWRAFETLYRDGYIKAIGVSNFTPFYLRPLLEIAEIIPHVNQIEYHPGQTQAETVAYCKNLDIQIEAWSPLGAGKMLQKPELQNIAEKYHKSVAQICIRWCLQNGIVALPKSVTPDRIRENISVFDFELAEDDMALIDALPYFGGSGLTPDDFEANLKGAPNDQ